MKNKLEIANKSIAVAASVTGVIVNLVTLAMFIKQIHDAKKYAKMEAEANRYPIPVQDGPGISGDEIVTEEELKAMGLDKISGKAVVVEKAPEPEKKSVKKTTK